MSDDERHLFQQIIASFDTPAYMRRARDVEAAWNEIIMRCQRKYDELVEMPKLRLAQLHALTAGRLSALPAFTKGLISADHAAKLQELFDQWRPELQAPIRPTSSPIAVQSAASRLVESFARFNTQWQSYLSKIDLSEVNRLRCNYNQYYLLEKECVVHSPAIARIGFEPLEMVDHPELAERFPKLPIQLTDG